MELLIQHSAAIEGALSLEYMGCMIYDDGASPTLLPTTAKWALSMTAGQGT
jgi:hypothetical protein